MRSSNYFDVLLATLVFAGAGCQPPQSQQTPVDISEKDVIGKWVLSYDSSATNFVIDFHDSNNCAISYVDRNGKKLHPKKCHWGIPVFEGKHRSVKVDDLHKIWSAGALEDASHVLMGDHLNPQLTSNMPYGKTRLILCSPYTDVMTCFERAN